MNITAEGNDIKQYWTIGEVAEQLELAESNIRFWCAEFELSAHRSKTNHRRFTLSDITKLKVIKILVHDQKFTNEGAKEKLAKLKFPMSVTRIEQEVKLQLSRIIAACLIIGVMASCSPSIVRPAIPIDSVCMQTNLEKVRAKKEQRKETKHLLRNYAVMIVVFGLGIHYMGWDEYNK